MHANIRNSLLAAVAALAFWAAPAAAGSNPDQPEYRGKLKDEVLYLLLKQPQGYVLPHFYVFDAGNTAIFHKVGYDTKFVTTLDQALKDGHSPSVPAPFPLTTFLGWVDFGANAVPAADQSGTLTFVEFWAPWCGACKRERHAINGYLDDHPELKVRWINVDADPDTMDPALRKKAEQEQREAARQAAQAGRR